MICYNCGAEMQSFNNLRGMKENSHPLVDTVTEDETFSRFDTLVLTKKHNGKVKGMFGREKIETVTEKHYFNPVYNVCPKCGLVAQSIAKKDMSKLFEG